MASMSSAKLLVFTLINAYIIDMEGPNVMINAFVPHANIKIQQEKRRRGSESERFSPLIINVGFIWV